MADSFSSSLPEYIDLVMKFVPGLIIIAIPVAIFIAYKKSKNETEKAKRTAALLGLRYVNVADEMKGSKPQDSLLLGLLSSWSPWAMEGRYNGVAVRVEQVVKANQHRYIPHSGMVSVSNPTRTSYSKGTVYTATFEKPLPFDVHIHPNVAMPSFLITMRSAMQQGREDDTISTGSAELDTMITVSGSDRDRINEWLDQDQRKDTLKMLYQALPMMNIDSSGLRYHDTYTRADHRRVQDNLRAMSDAVRSLATDR